MALLSDKSICTKPDKWLWPTTVAVVTQTHLSRIAQKSLSVLCRGSLPMLTKKQNISFKGPTGY